MHVEESLVAWKLMATQCVHFTPAVQAEAVFNAMKDIRHSGSGENYELGRQ